MPTSSNPSRTQARLVILSLVSITFFCGCDLGTYKKRLNESPAQQTQPAESANDTEEASEQ